MNKYCVLTLFLFSFSTLIGQIELSGVINNYTEVIAIDEDDCKAQLSVSDATPFEVGNQVVLIQMQGAEINESNSSAYGNITNLNGAGYYEINEIVSVNGTDVFLKHQLANDYNVSGKVQLINMPVYQNAEVVDFLTASAWDGSTGGVLAFQVDGQLFMEAEIDVSGLGFRGGVAQTASSNDCTWLIQQDDYFYGIDNWRGSTKGEGVAQAISDKESGKGAQANGGGGGNDHNSGGAGGGQISNGGNGGKNEEPSTFGCKGNHPGIGGKGILDANNRLFLGGGGGAGHENNNAATDGANGGGIVIMIVNEFYPLGHSILANGNTPENGGGDGAGGAGAGGTILLDVENIISTIHFDAKGGDGGLANNSDADRCHGPGGGGSGGRIITNLGAGDPFSTGLNGGQAGLSINSTSCSDGNNGAQNGEDGVLEPLNAMVIASEEFLIPVADFMFVENGSTLDFSNLSIHADAYVWDYGDMNTSTLENPSHTYANNGTYTIQLIATNNCGSDTLTQEVTIELSSAPSAAFSFDVQSGCAPLTVNFLDESVGTVDTYNWTFEGGTPGFASTANPQVVYNTPGVYAVELTIVGPGGTDVLLETSLIEILAEPTAGFNFSINGGAVSFSNTSTEANTSQWNFGDNVMDNSVDPSHTYSQNGTYEVQLVVANDCGADTMIQEVIIDIQNIPTAAFTLDDGNGCAPLLVNFNDASLGGVDAYSWTFEGGDPATSTAPNPQVLYTIPGIYDVQLEISGSNGNDLILMEDLIVVVPAVETSFGYNVDESEVSFINNSANATTYQWDFGDGSANSTEENPVHEYAEPGTYQVTLIATSDLCGMSVTETLFLDFVDVVDIEQSNFIKVFPNPVKDVLNIETEFEGISQVMIYTLGGKEIVALTQPFSKILDVDIGGLVSGVYVLVIENDGVLYRHKLVKLD